MLARLGLALAILFSVSTHAAPSCIRLKELLLDFPDFKIISEVKPSVVRASFELGKDIILPVKNMVLDIAKGRITVKIWSTENFYGSNVDINLPLEAFDPSTGLLKPSFSLLVPIKGKYTAELTYENGILTYKEFQDMVFAWDNIWGMRKTQVETEYRTVRMEVDASLNQFGAVDFTQKIIDEAKQERILNTVETAGPRTTEPVFYNN